MDEVKEDYLSDLKKKQSIARSAKALAFRAKKNQVQTEKELRKMNGPDYTVSADRFIDYETFKTLPKAVKREWAIAVSEKWKVGTSAFAKAWNLHPSYTYKMFRKNEISFRTGRQKTKVEDLEVFLRDFVQRAPNENQSLSEQDRAVPYASYNEFSVTLSCAGLIDAEALIRQFSAVIPKQQTVKITLTVESMN